MKSGTPLRLLLGLALATSACLATPALAQNVSAQTTKIIELNRAGKFSEALTLAQKTLADAEKARGPVHRDGAEQSRPGLWQPWTGFGGRAALQAGAGDF